jgi:predicted nucleotide-binding protein (sugar kinase/HSP70/actin superfamily)
MKPESPRETPEFDPAGDLPHRLKEELRAFEAAARRKLGLPDASRPQWSEAPPLAFTESQRASTTILLGGLAPAHDQFLTAALRPLGYHVEMLPPTDNEALQIGMAYCDRGMCNPAYYVVGNLLRHLVRLRDEKGLSTQEIIQRYLSVTANGCGPCRYGLYVGQYRKALRETGFEGFRVQEFEQTPHRQLGGEAQGLDMNLRLMFHVVRALILGDVVNLLKHRTRPYEREAGATEAAAARSCEHISGALEQRHGLFSALRAVRREFAAVPVDRSRVKPKVAIIGEIWAQTTEGEGNYRLPAFLEEEGAEVETQPLTNWVSLLFWEPRYDLRRKARLLSASPAGDAAAPTGLWWKLPALRAGEGLVRAVFALLARLAGLRGYTLPSIEALSRISAPFYNTNQKGGEMFMEVGKMLHYSAHADANLVVSVKPFGCMPSSSVSDGVQSLVTERRPQTLFLALETTGDGEVNVYSRLQMQLFKATQIARGEAQRALDSARITREEALLFLERHPRLNHALRRSRRRFACAAANLFDEIGRRPRFRLRRWWRARGWFS